MSLPILQVQFIEDTFAVVNLATFQKSITITPTVLNSTILILFGSRAAGSSSSADSATVTDDKLNVYTIENNGALTDRQPTPGIAIVKNAIQNTQVITVQYIAHNSGTDNYAIVIYAVEIANQNPTLNFGVNETTAPGFCISPNGESNCAVTPMSIAVADSHANNNIVEFTIVGSLRCAALLDLFSGVGTDTWLMWQQGYVGSDWSGFVPDPLSYLDSVTVTPAGWSSVIHEIGNQGFCTSALFVVSVSSVIRSISLPLPIVSLPLCHVAVKCFDRFPFHHNECTRK